MSLRTILARIRAFLRGSSSDPAPSSPTSPAPTSPAHTSPSPAPAEIVDWIWGGFNGARAAVDPDVVVDRVRIADDRISHRWTSPPRTWKREQTSKGALVLACAFVRGDDGRWIGGKFDWTDETRSSRSTENILAGYNGWDASAWRSARERGYCVASPDGRHRSAIVSG